MLFDSVILKSRTQFVESELIHWSVIVHFRIRRTTKPERIERKSFERFESERQASLRIFKSVEKRKNRKFETEKLYDLSQFRINLI